VDEAIEIILPIMGALSAAHSHGIVHRDVKPENIVLARSASGELVPKLVDFGIAKVHAAPGAKNLTMFGNLIGTAQYMSPEQAHGMPGVDARTDVWAVGVVLFELISGVCPFDAPSLSGILAKIVTPPSPRLDAAISDVPSGLADVVARSLDLDLIRRFPTMQAFRDDLFSFVNRRPRTPSFLASSRFTSVFVPPVQEPRGELREEGDRWLAIDEKLPAFGLEDVIDELDPDDLLLVEEPAPPGEGTPQAALKVAMSPRQAAARGEIEDSVDWSHVYKKLENEHATAADQALHVNNLAEAIEHADGALRTASLDEDLAGRMWLVKASAHHWLGDYVEAERCAGEAQKRLPRGGRSWYSALGYLVIANGYLGRREPLESILEEVNSIQVSPSKTDVHTILLCRVAISLVRTGASDVAQNILTDIWLDQGLSVDAEVSDAIVQAWLDLARAEIAALRGDVATYLRRVESAVDNLSAAGALRDACLQRSNIGAAYMQLGAHRRAAAVLKESLDVAEPMRLGFIGSVKATLGFALAHLGQLDQGLLMEEAAVQHCQKQNNKRGEAIAWIYLASIRSMRDELDEATRAAEQGIAAASATPALRAYGLATLARMLLQQRQPAAALERAEEAMSLLEQLGEVADGESLIRCVHALCLRNNEKEPEGRKRIAEAKRLLLERANRINEPHWRQSFLEGVRDNDRLMQLAEQWLGG
jgi:eukaryotic-like serine/threonine-protein kinase